MANLASCVVAGAVASVCMISSASAAAITGTPIDSPASPTSISERGTVDWAYWDRRNNDSVASLAPTNQKVDGAGLISSATPVNGSTVRGSGTITGISLKFDDGISPATATSHMISGVFNTSLGWTSNGYGVQVDVTLPDTELYRISLWVSGYYGRGNLTASLPGADDYTDSSFLYTVSKTPKMYELEVSADNPGDVLTISYVLSNVDNANSHVLIGAVGISLVPEPAALGVLVPALFLAARRRRSE